MMVESNIRVIAQSGKLTIGELREFIDATDYMMKNAVVEVELDDDGHLSISANERLVRGPRS